MEGCAFVFINTEQAVRFGHVGWGFCIDSAKGLYYFGSSDHLYRHPWWDLPGWLRYAHVEPDADIDWWSNMGTYEEMMSVMSSGQSAVDQRYRIWYHMAKEIPVPAARPQPAVAAAQALAGGGWSVLANNCVHQTYQVLTEYGAFIPAPAQPVTNLIPRLWFATLPGRQVNLPLPNNNTAVII